MLKFLNRVLKLIRSKKEIIISFVIYGLGLLAWLLVDLIIASKYSTTQIAEWAFLKSTVIIVGTFCLLGYDQVFVRDQSLIKRVFKKFSFQTILFALLTCTAIYFLKNESFKFILILFQGIILFAILSYFSAGSRANFNLWKAQFSTNFWKIILLILIIFYPLDTISVVFLMALFIGVFLSGLLKGFIPSGEKSTESILDDKTARNLGWAFVLHNMTLILAVHGEQFLINLYGDAVSSAHLFRYFAVFTPIALSVNGFLGFYYGPKLRRENNMNVPKFKKFSRNIIFFSVVITSFSLLFGFGYMKLIYNYSFTDFDLFLILALFILCIIRGAYIATSVCLGVFATKEYLRKTAYLNWGSTIFYILLVTTILVYTNGIQSAQLIAYASVINWLLRLLITNKYTFITLQLKSNKSAALQLRNE